MKKRGFVRPLNGYKPIHMPKNTGAGIILSGLATVFGFAMIWYIWWLAALSFVAIVLGTIVHTFNYNRDFYISAEEVTRTEEQRSRLLGTRA